MAMASGEVYLVTRTSESGVTRRLRDTEYIRGKTEIGTKESGSNASSMDRAQTYLRIKTLTPGSIKMGNLMGRDSIHGVTALSTSANLKVA
jgi:hypothetical protein